MDSELQAIREARLAQLKNGSGGAGGNSSGNGSTGNNGSGSSTLAPFLEPQALERLSRVSLVRPERAAAVETYLKRVISSGQLKHKINENEIVQILNGISKQENSQTDSRIIFERKDNTDPFDDESVSNSKNQDQDSEDDFFDE
ncbi:hypothetical protein MOUN0_K03202 [Monosporozyma unispora]